MRTLSRNERIAMVTRLSRWTELTAEDFTQLLSADCEYINVPMPELKRIGPAQTYELLTAMAQDWAMPGLDVHHVACDGDAVLIERTEHFENRSDGSRFSLPSMGVFAFTGDRISLWKDYFDLNHVKPLLGLAAAAAATADS